MGRPSKYKPEFAEQAAQLCKLGATDPELASFFKIADSTLSQWKVTHPEFADALRAGKEAADNRVQNSLYQRAIGFEHDEIDIRVVAGKVVQTPIRKRYPPDTVACIFWLKNRRRDEWRDKVETEHSGTVRSVVVQTTPTDEAL